MSPDLFQIDLAGLPVIAVPSFGFFVMTGFLVGAWVAVRRARTVGLEGGRVLDLGLVAMVAGIVGARIGYVIQFPAAFDYGILEPELATLRSPWAWAAGAGAAIVTLLATRSYGLRVRLSLALVGALAAARIGYVSEHRAEFDFALLRVDQGGLVFFGGVALGAAFAVAFARAHRMPLLRTADVISPSIALGLAFGRIGCYLNGCCFGSPCELPWAVRYARESSGTMGLETPAFIRQATADPALVDAAAFWTLPVHPTQIYASVAAFALFAVTARAHRRRRFDGDVTTLAAMMYAVVRFGLEILRDDSPVTFTGGTAAQNLSVLLFGVALAARFLLGKMGRQTARPGKAKREEV